MSGLEKEINNVIDMMVEVIEDRSVPRNIRAAVQTGIEKMETTPLKGINVSSAIYDLDDISNDINMPSHTRTTIWEIISALESIKENLKE